MRIINEIWATFRFKIHSIITCYFNVSPIWKQKLVVKYAWFEIIGNLVYKIVKSYVFDTVDECFAGDSSTRKYFLSKEPIAEYLLTLRFVNCSYGTMWSTRKKRNHLSNEILSQVKEHPRLYESECK